MTVTLDKTAASTQSFTEKTRELLRRSLISVARTLRWAPDIS